MTARTTPDDHRPPGGRAAWTAIGRAGGRHRMLLIATCTALVLAAIGDEVPGYDGPGPFIGLGFAAMVALVRWRFVPLLVVMSAVFLYGGTRRARVSAPADPAGPRAGLRRRPAADARLRRRRDPRRDLGRPCPPHLSLTPPKRNRSC